MEDNGCPWTILIAFCSLNMLFHVAFVMKAQGSTILNGFSNRIIFSNLMLDVLFLWPVQLVPNILIMATFNGDSPPPRLHTYLMCSSGCINWETTHVSRFSLSTSHPQKKTFRWENHYEIYNHKTDLGWEPKIDNALAQWPLGVVGWGPPAFFPSLSCMSSS